MFPANMVITAHPTVYPASPAAQFPASMTAQGIAAAAAAKQAAQQTTTANKASAAAAKEAASAAKQAARDQKEALALTAVAAKIAGHEMARGYGLAKTAVLEFAGAANPYALVTYHRAVLDLKAAIGQAFLPVLNVVTKGVRVVADAIYNLSPRTKAWGVVLVLAAGALGLVASAALTAGAAIAGVGLIVSGVISVFTAVGAPAVAVFVAIAAAAAAIGAALLGTEQGRALLSELAKDALAAGQAFAAWALAAYDELKPAIDEVGDAVGELMGAVKELYDEAKPIIKGMAEAFGGELVDGIKAALWVVKELVELTKVEVEALTMAVGAAKALSGLVTTGKADKAAGDKGGEGIGNVVGKLASWGTLPGFAKNAWESISGIFDWAGSGGSDTSGLKRGFASVAFGDEAKNPGGKSEATKAEQDGKDAGSKFRKAFSLAAAGDVRGAWQAIFGDVGGKSAFGLGGGGNVGTSSIEEAYRRIADETAKMAGGQSQLDVTKEIKDLLADFLTFAKVKTAEKESKPPNRGWNLRAEG